MDDVLVHYGVKGMKWGIRRTPAQLGHEIKKKLKRGKGDDDSSSEKSSGSAKGSSGSKNSRKTKKRIQDMSDSELQSYYNRLNLERNTIQAQMQLAQLSSKKVSRGRRMVRTVVDQVVKPNVLNAGKNYLQNALNQKQTSDDPLKPLRDEVEELRLRSQKVTFEDNIRKHTGGSSSSGGSSGTDRTSSTSSSSASNRAYEQTVSTGRNFITNDRMLMDTSIAGLLPPGDDDYRRR